jgi:hypothetical protein
MAGAELQLGTTVIKGKRVLVYISDSPATPTMVSR